MNFDEFDAPQFVDFSEENFDAGQEGDSWFSNDSSDLQVEEVELDENCPIDWNGYLQNSDQTKSSHGLPSWVREYPDTPTPVVVVADPSFPSSYSTTPTKTTELYGASRGVTAAAAPSTEAPIVRWRRATKRASLEQQRRLSLTTTRTAEARRKAAQRTRQWNRTPAKNDGDGELTPAKRMKTDERPNRRMQMNKSSVIDKSRLKAIPAAIVDASHHHSARDLTSQSHETVRNIGNNHWKRNHDPDVNAPSVVQSRTHATVSNIGYSHRKRIRDPEVNATSVEQSPQSLVQFSAKNALGTTQTFQFGGVGKVGSSTKSFSTASSSSTTLADVIRFHARPAPSANSRTFQPKLGRRRCIEVKEFHFHTKDRAQARRELDAERAESLARLREVEDQRRLEKEEKDRQDLKNHRETLVHKPTPINHGQPFIVSASAKKLTNPESPNLSHKQNKRAS